MSIVADYRATEQAIAELQAKLAHLQQDEKLKDELKFEEKLRGLMGEHGKSLRDIIAILDPKGSTKVIGKGNDKPDTQRKMRKVKQYKNPHNGEVIETKGGNHKTLKEWKSQWGAEEVETWATLLD